MELKPLPPFYAVYLLRSQRHSSSLYIGSTPHPRRRLAQHNGTSRGGALRTRRAAPWDMICLVQGFPSPVAALQFEWTWQNPHLTRRIAPEDRITHPGSTTSYRSGRPRKRPMRPRTGLKDRLANLNLLLRVPSFARWPLKVRFFTEDVYEVWRDKVVGKNDHVDAILDLNAEETADPQAANASGEKETSMRKRRNKSANANLPTRLKVVHDGGVQALDVSYERFQPVLEKARFVLAEGERARCAVCSKTISEEEFSTTLLCSEYGCHATSHLMCLSRLFLAHEEHSSDQQAKAIVPSKGNCPSCDKDLEWIELITALSLRMRDSKLVDRIVDKTRRKQKGPSTGQKSQNWLVVPDSEEDSAEGSEEGILLAPEGVALDEDLGVELEDADDALRAEDVVDEPFLWEGDAEDASSVASSDAAVHESARRRPRPVFRVPKELTETIEDSEEEVER